MVTNKLRLIMVVFMAALCITVSDLAFAAAKINVADYFLLTLNDTWMYTGEKAGGITVNGTKVINGVTTMCFHWDYNNSTQYYTIDRSGVKNYGTTNVYNGQAYNTIFNSPLSNLPQYVTVGKTYASSVTYTSGVPAQNYSLKVSLTIDGYEDVKVNGVVFKNAIKLTESDIQARQSDGQTTVSKYDLWYVEDLGLVKEYYYDNGQTRYIQSAVIHYADGLKKAELLAAPDAKGYVYYEYEDKNFKGTGVGRITKEQRADGSYNVIKYWGNTGTIRDLKEYNANGVLVSEYKYNRKGKLINQKDTYRQQENNKNNSNMNEITKRYQVEQTVISQFSDHFVGQLAGGNGEPKVFNGVAKK